MSDGMTHARELDEAIAAAGGPDGLGICETALGSRTKALIDDQIDWASDPENRTAARKALMDTGAPFDDETVDQLQLRGAIGGAFSHGIAVGLALAEQRSRG